MSLYIDTSLLVAYYAPEAISRQAETILQTASPPVVSDLVETDRQLASAASALGVLHILMESPEVAPARARIRKSETKPRTRPRKG